MLQETFVFINPQFKSRYIQRVSGSDKRNGRVSGLTIRSEHAGKQTTISANVQ